MIIALHKNARTTPAIRAEIAASSQPVAVLANLYNVGEGTIRRWKTRSVFTDASHTAHRLQTTLTPAQEAIAVELRKMLLLLDDLLAVCREFLCPDVFRSSLDRRLRRHGVGSPEGFAAGHTQGASKGLKTYEPGYVHVDVKYLPQMADQNKRSCLFVAIDRATLLECSCRSRATRRQPGPRRS